MAYRTRARRSGFSYSGFFSTGVKWLLISNITLFVIYYFSVIAGYAWVFRPFGLVPGDVLRHFAIWQFGSYMFLHDPYGFGHIFWNMLALWLFGRDLEELWGTKRFLNFYLLCGVGAGVCVVVANLLFNSDNLNTPTIGASGAIYGLLLAFGMIYPDRVILMNFLFPIKAKYFVMIMGAIAFMSSFGGSGSGVSNVAHLGGMLFGYLYLKSYRPRQGVLSSLSSWYQDYKLQRAKKKFQVYLKKRGPGDDRWVN
jgi:membrane associated rhomboid family serine protease